MTTRGERVLVESWVVTVGMLLFVPYLRFEAAIGIVLLAFVGVWVFVGNADDSTRVVSRGILLLFAGAWCLIGPVLLMAVWSIAWPAVLPLEYIGLLALGLVLAVRGARQVIAEMGPTFQP